MKTPEEKTDGLSWGFRLGGGVALLAALVLIVEMRRGHGQAAAWGGSPLYELAVRESLAGLRGRPAQGAPGAGAAAAGVVPVHTNQAARSGGAAVAALPASLQRYYYYCSNCAAYHLRTQPLTNAVGGDPGVPRLPFSNNAPPILTNRVVAGQPPHAPVSPQ